MPQLQAISLLDRETTPVAHNFVPRDIINGVGTCVRYTGLLMGEETFSISSRRSGGKLRVKQMIRVPVVQTETINGVSVPKVVDVNYVVTEWILSESSTEQARKNLIGMQRDSLDPAKLLVNDSLVKGEGIYR